MKFTYVTALENLRITSTLENAIPIGDNLYLGNQLKHIDCPSLIKYYGTMGSLEFNGIFKGSCFLFRKAHTVNEDAGKIELINFLRDVNAYIHVLWLLRDNSVTFGLGFALGDDKEVIHSNSLNQTFTKADGSVSMMEIDIEEINGTSGAVGIVFKGATVQQYPKYTALQKSTTRISASNFHLQNARANNDLGLKIAQMCTYFECLFSTATAELSHQLSERIAFFTETAPSKRLETYKKIKKAYGIRSKIVHGDRITRDLDDLVGISEFCDKVARKVNELLLPDTELLEIMDSKDQTKLDAYMINLIFGVRTVGSGEEQEKTSI